MATWKLRAAGVCPEAALAHCIVVINVQALPLGSQIPRAGLSSLVGESSSSTFKTTIYICWATLNNRRKVKWLWYCHMTEHETALKKLVSKKRWREALTGVARVVGRCPAKRRVTGLTPAQDTCLGCGFHPGWGACKGQPIDVCILFPPPFPLSNQSINQ